MFSPSSSTIISLLWRYLITMAIKQESILSGKLGKEVHYPVKGVERVRTSPEHVNQPGTDTQKAHWGSFVDIVRLSSRMSDAAKIGMAYPARRKKSFPYLLFRSINKDCFTPEGNIDYPRVIISLGTVARVDITSVKIQTIDESYRRAVTITFDPCLQSSNANPDDELYLFAYCPSHCEGVLYEPVPRIASTHTAILPARWFLSEPSTNTVEPSNNQEVDIHLYAFLRCPGPTADTPPNACASARNRRGQTSTTIYIPLSHPLCPM